jgi:hypothetical protein
VGVRYVRCGFKSTIEVLVRPGWIARASSTRVKRPWTLGSKRISFVASVPTIVTSPVDGSIPIAMHRFIRRWT